MVYDLGFGPDYGEQIDPECEPDVEWDAICPNNHAENREALRELIKALYDEDGGNIDFIEEQLQILANNYGVTLPKESINLVYYR